MNRKLKIPPEGLPYGDCGREMSYPQGLKWTKQRKSVYRALWETAEPISAIQIYQRMSLSQTVFQIGASLFQIQPVCISILQLKAFRRLAYPDTRCLFLLLCHKRQLQKTGQKLFFIRNVLFRHQLAGYGTFQIVHPESGSVLF